MKRLLLLAPLLFVAPLRGAELARVQAAPLQLSFAFAAAPAPLPLASALPTVAPVLAAPAPLLAPVAPLASVAAVPAAKDEDRPDGRSQLQRLARDADAPGKSFDTTKRATKMDYDEFGRQLAATPGLDMNAFRHTSAKRRILAASGYTHLYGAGGVRIPLSEANDVRVGNAFLSVKKTFDRRP